MCIEAIKTLLNLSGTNDDSESDTESSDED